ncbi:MAG TPA: chromosome segregation protein SMC [Thermodesulforhabdus norvegica]|uniref:Chromosome segregation protein SMC n=1 Tax=Thermodesulforhabdus norvegica TaxID=39841 RepID=A0A7C1ALW6_9BACT|nr:chromosome segregation protein SMC [Thermodesulforhabdus norvegica]
MSIKITQFKAERFKRIECVELEPTEDGLTIIGGKNSQGKTSILSAIAWALGGDKYKPSNPANDEKPPELKIELSNGLIVERKGKNSSLKVTDPLGLTGGQKLLDKFIEKLAIDLPTFIESDDKKKAQAILKIIGVGEELEALDREEKEQVEERTIKGRVKAKAYGHLESLTFHDAVPEELDMKQLMSDAELYQDSLKKRDDKEKQLLENNEEIKEHEDAIATLRREMALTEQMLRDGTSREALASGLKEIREKIEGSQKIASMHAENNEYKKAKGIFNEYEREHEDLTVLIKHTREKRKSLMDNAEMPLADLEIEDGRLIYKGQPWDGMAGSDQLKVATAVVRKLNPDCGFVLLDKLEQMDSETLKEFGEWAASEGLQIIGTRVSTGEECSLIIEEGRNK